MFGQCGERALKSAKDGMSVLLFLCMSSGGTGTENLGSVKGGEIPRRYIGISSLKKDMVVEFSRIPARVLTVIDPTTVQVAVDTDEERFNGTLVVRGLKTEDLVTGKRVEMPRWCKVVGKYVGKNVLGVRLDVWELQAARVKVVEQLSVKRFSKDIATVVTTDGKTYKNVETVHYRGKVAGTNKYIYKVFIKSGDRYLWLEPEKVAEITAKGIPYTFDKGEGRFRWEGLVRTEIPEF